MPTSTRRGWKEPRGSRKSLEWSQESLGGGREPKIPENAFGKGAEKKEERITDKFPNVMDRWYHSIAFLDS